MHRAGILVLAMVAAVAAASEGWRLAGPELGPLLASDGGGAVANLWRAVVPPPGRAVTVRALPMAHALALVARGRLDATVAFGPVAGAGLHGLPLGSLPLALFRHGGDHRGAVDLAAASGEIVGSVVDGAACPDLAPAFERLSGAGALVVARGNQPHAHLVDRLVDGSIDLLVADPALVVAALRRRGLTATTLRRVAELPARVPVQLVIAASADPMVRASLAAGLEADAWLEALASGGLARRADGTIVAAATDHLELLTEELPPLNHLVEGQPQGYAVEVVQAIQARLGLDLPIRFLPWSEGYERALSRPGVALFSTTRTAEREDRFAWVGPLVRFHKSLWRRADQELEIASLEDAKAVRAIATYQDDVNREWLQARGFENLTLAQSAEQALAQVLAGEADLWLGGAKTGAEILAKLGRSREELVPTIDVNVQDLYIAFSQGTDASVVEAWRGAFAAVREDGTLAGLYGRYFPGESPPGMAESALDGTAGLLLVTEDRPPLNYLQDGELTGFSVEVVKAVMDRLGVDHPISVQPWERAYAAALERSDVALFSAFRTEARIDKFHWVGPLVSSRLAFYARKGEGIQLRELAEAKRLGKIGTYGNDAKEQYLKSQGFTNLVSARDAVTNIRHLASGWVDVIIDTDLSLAFTALKAGVDPATIEMVLPVKELTLYIAFNRATPPATIRAWQDALDAVKADGTFGRLERKWLVLRDGGGDGEGTARVLAPDDDSRAPERASDPANAGDLALLTEVNPPASFHQDSVLTGHSVEVVREIQRRLGRDDPLTVLPWSEGYARALSEPGVGLFSTSRTPNREPLFHWVGPLYRNHWCLFAFAADAEPLADLDQARSVRAIGTYRDDVIEQHLAALGFTNLRSAPSLGENLAQALTGDVDYLAMTDLQLLGAAMQAGIDPADLDVVHVFREQGVYLAFSRATDPAVAELWRQVLADMHTDGTFQRIAGKWLPPRSVPTAVVTAPPPPPPVSEPAPTVGSTVAVDGHVLPPDGSWLVVVVAIAVGLIGVTWVLRRK